MPDDFKDLKGQLDKLSEGSDFPSLENDLIIYEGNFRLTVYETSAGRGKCNYEVSQYHFGVGWQKLSGGVPMSDEQAIENGLINLAYESAKAAGLHSPANEHIEMLIEFIYWAETLKGLEGKSGDPNDLANQWESAYAGLYAQAEIARQFLTIPK